jgi:hypothetical protein
MTEGVPDGKISHDLYARGVICTGSGSVLFPPDPEFPERGVCLWCSCSITVIDDHHLDDHLVLPEMMATVPAWVTQDVDDSAGG